MHTRFLFVCTFLGLVLLAACTKPIDSDFSGEKRVGLADDEMVWVLQVYREGTPALLPEGKTADTSKIVAYNLPIFEQVLPEIIRDLVNGKLDGYENFEVAEEQKKIDDIEARLRSLGVSKKDFSPFTHVFEIFSVVKSQRGKYRSEDRFIQLIWHDPKGKQPNRIFAAVRLDQIRENGDYPLILDGYKSKFIPFLSLQRFEYFPAFVRDNRREYNIQSPEEADYLRDMVANGHWDEVEWVEGKINTSGRKRIALEHNLIKEFAGIYRFPVTKPDSSGKTRELYITAERDYLIADWTHRFKVEKVLPFMENAFFSPTGEVYVFDFEQDTFTGKLFFLSHSDTTVGELALTP